MAVIINGSNTPTAGGIIYGDGSEYDVTAAGTAGQVLQSNGASAPTWTTVSSGLTLGTPVVTTSGSSVTFTGIPAGTKQLIVSFSDVSLTGSNNVFIRLGTSSGIETTGYLAGAARIVSAGTSANNNSSAFVINVGSDGASINGSVIFTLENVSTNIFAGSGVLGSISGAAGAFVVGGSKPLAGVLDRVQILPNGADTFDLGEINIAYA